MSGALRAPSEHGYRGVGVNGPRTKAIDEGFEALGNVLGRLRTTHDVGAGADGCIGHALNIVQARTGLGRAVPLTFRGARYLVIDFTGHRDRLANALEQAAGDPHVVLARMGDVEAALHGLHRPLRAQLQLADDFVNLAG